MPCSLFEHRHVYIYLFIETEGRHANAKAQEAVDTLASFMWSREEISQPRFKPPTSSTTMFTLNGCTNLSTPLVGESTSSPTKGYINGTGHNKMAIQLSHALASFFGTFLILSLCLRLIPMSSTWRCGMFPIWQMQWHILEGLSVWWYIISLGQVMWLCFANVELKYGPYFWSCWRKCINTTQSASKFSYM